MRTAILLLLLIPALTQAQPDKASLQRGAYLAIAGDCSACHRNPDNGHPFSGGYRISSPLGDIIATNITPSKVNGIGNYTLADFRRVMREGRRRDGGYLYPAMPYTAFASLTESDITALYDYFMFGVAAEDHAVPATQLPFPFSVRSTMALWNALFLSREHLASGSADAVSSARGEYLVKTLGHCGSCHTPRNLMMAEKSDHFLRGGHVGSWQAPDLTQARLYDWTEADLATYLKTGSLPGKAVAAGEMGTAVENSFSRLNDNDRQAIARYLLTLGQAPADRLTTRLPNSGSLTRVETGPAASLSRAIDGQQMSGAQLYNAACASCHGAEGEGSHDRPQTFPRLTGSSAVTNVDPANLIMTVAEGVNRTTAAGHAFMPAFSNQMSSSELARLLDYVATQFGDGDRHITEKQVSQTLHHPRHNPWLQGAPWLGLCVLALLCLAVWRYRSQKRSQHEEISL
ncbi:cytochrome c [Candidatus Pantoea deserta]|uniref:Cytochrome c n=1 Tax=Candidatus Pantoea deserta TaxID=1869313 RepID=A0A3N4NY16_9GAMM|nr:cytochrome c [Pantoea deserta]RPE01293.1 cytochrome c [Pantoea deserta]